MHRTIDRILLYLCCAVVLYNYFPLALHDLWDFIFYTGIPHAFRGRHW